MSFLAVFKLSPVILSFPILFYVVYKLLRPFFKSNVNCWFCNKNSFVPYNDRNGFICPRCEQYNGFKEDGDYNKVIVEQKYEYLNPTPRYSEKKNALNSRPDLLTHSSGNGLCRQCNCQQNLVQMEINRFEPINEKNYDYELKEFKSRLYKAYPLCADCKEYTQKKIESDREKLGIPVLSAIGKRVASTVGSIYSGTFRNSTPGARPGPHSVTSANRSYEEKKVRKRAQYFNCGPVANILNVFTLFLSFILFVTNFVNLSNESDVEILDLGNALPTLVTSNIVPFVLKYSAQIIIVALGGHLISLQVSRARTSLPDLLAVFLWCLLGFFKLRPVSDDIIFCQAAFASLLTIAACAVTLLPRKLLHRKKPNNFIKSAFSIASTPISQCSTISSASPHNVSLNHSRHNQINTSIMSPNWNTAKSDPRRARASSVTREVTSRFDSMSLDNGENISTMMKQKTPRRGPFNSMTKPILAGPRFRLNSSPSVRSFYSSASHYGKPRSLASSSLTSLSHTTASSPTLFNIICLSAAVLSLCVNGFLLYKMMHIKI